ncbi:hypothetical protein KR093_009622 [Drosophila rubida]|uniref:Uncharacterized protein n=1 Tax=Drosophila rubida TaxID=30044 RepID=A0AAD4PP53_9MUSC|nr:hypothetical protein KR093_009622 [Drosophila rubida]
MSGWFWLCTVLGLLSLEVDGKSNERNYMVVINQISLRRVEKEYFDDVHCVLAQIRNRSTIDCSLILRRSVDKIDMEVYLDFMRPNNQNIRLFNARLEVCEMWSFVHKNPLINLLAKTFIKVIDPNIRCPLRKNYNYTLTNWYLDENDFPGYIPEGGFQTITEYIIRKKRILRIVTRGRIIY